MLRKVKITARDLNIEIFLKDSVGNLINRAAGSMELELLPGSYTINYGPHEFAKFTLNDKDREFRQFDYWYWADMKSYLLSRDKVCLYCGITLDKFTAKIDHMIPRARGGGDNKYNLALCCSDCNSNKKDMLPLEFIQWKLDRT